MSRLVYAAATLIALAACRPGEPAAGFPRPAPLPDAEPMLRVGVTVDSTRVTVGAADAFEFVRAGAAAIANGNAGEEWVVTSPADGQLEARTAGRTTGVIPGSLRVLPRGGTVRISGREYRGEVLLLPRAAGMVTAVNVVELETYLLGVVPREIGRRPPSEIEAVKAQAVAARTYAIGNMGARAAQGFDVFASIMDQAYGGIADEDSVAARAVRETHGEILTWAGQPILAYYSSTCGGRTAAIEESWPWRAPLPYLKSVSDRIPGSDSSYCSTSNRFTWTASWTRAQLLEVLGQTLRAHTGRAMQVSRVSGVEQVDSNAAGRATVRLTADGQDHVLRSDSVRWVLRPPPGTAILNSSRISDIDAAYEGGEVETLAIHGGGWGHGIGMCQVGAMGRARAGHSYEQILTTYYSGTELQRLY